MERIEAPLDYRSLWMRLGVELKEMASDIARRAVTERDLARVPRHQGAFEFVQNVQGKMEELLGAARSDNGNGRYAAEDDA
jgi:hypothetical protein